MNNTDHNYDFIKTKIQNLKELYPSLRNKEDDYVFSILCIKSNFYKNPSLALTESEMSDIIVDGANDGGIDALLTDPNSEESNLVLVQSKFYRTISSDEINNAITKIFRFYQNMLNGDYGSIQQKIISKFITLNAEVGDESKIVFVLYTSAPKAGIRNDKIDKNFKSLTNNNDKFELYLYYGEDICDEIKEAESRRPTVESGKLYIDEANNCLWYEEDKAIVANVSAFCIKELYGTHGINLLSRNLRYHVRGADIDRAIKETIRDNPNSFWFKNNGLTIICDEFDVSGKEVKLKNFSIVNGGQTTYNLFKSKDLNKESDFYLPCKIIRVEGNNEDEKNKFSLEIAKATNSQKAIKQIDLKANSPEQVRFSRTMRAHEIFYQTKRGEAIPKEYKEKYKNTDLSEVGKLCLAAIFQLPATSRNRPSTLYNSEYYDPIFNGNQNKIASIVKELLYVNHYFKNRFLKRFDDKYSNDPNAEELIPFGHNARTTCIAFVGFAARYHLGNINNDQLQKFFRNINTTDPNYIYDLLKNLDGVDHFFPPNLVNNKEKFDDILFKLFEGIIKAGRRCYAHDKKYETKLNATNYLKNDVNYYNILKDEWDSLSELIATVFEEVDSTF